MLPDQSAVAADPDVVLRPSVAIPTVFDILEARNARRPHAFVIRATREAWTTEQRTLASNARSIHTEAELRSVVSVEVLSCCTGNLMQCRISYPGSMTTQVLSL